MLLRSRFARLCRAVSRQSQSGHHHQRKKQKEVWSFSRLLRANQDSRLSFLFSAGVFEKRSYPANSSLLGRALMEGATKGSQAILSAVGNLGQHSRQCVCLKNQLSATAPSGSMTSFPFNLASITLQESGF